VKIDKELLKELELRNAALFILLRRGKISTSELCGVFGEIYEYWLDTPSWSCAAVMFPNVLQAGMFDKKYKSSPEVREQIGQIFNEVFRPKPAKPRSRKR
jgi:hypothetical protein